MIARRPARWGNVVYWALWGVVVALYLAWPLMHLEAYAWSNDEGLYVQRAALANAGYPLYTETFFNKPPLLIWILQIAFQVAGQTLSVARLASLCLSLLGFVALGAVAGQMWGRWAGLASAAVLLGLREVPVRAHVVTSDLPAMAFALLALGTALAFRRSGKRIWMMIAGASFTSSLLIHPLLIYTAVPLAVALFLPGLDPSDDDRARSVGWGDLAAFLIPAVGLGLIVLATVNRRAFFKWVIQYNFGTVDEVVRYSRHPDSVRMIEYLRQRWTLLWLAAVGIVTLLTRPIRRSGVVVAASWFFATVGLFLLWSPVWSHYMLFLALPLAWVAGGGLAARGEWVIGGCKGEHGIWWHLVLTVLAFVGVIVFVGERYDGSTSQLVEGPEWSPDQLAVRTFLENDVSPNAFVAADDPLLTFAAGRLVPPPMTGASHKRIRSGNLTAEDMIGIVLRYRADVVLFATGRLEQLPTFEQWVASTAAEQHDFETARAYQLDLPKSPARTCGSRLGSSIELSGYTLSSNEIQPGDVLTATLFWKIDSSVDEDYHVFVHLIDEDGHLRGQHDGPPLMDFYPTSYWEEGVLVPDLHTLVVDPDASLGSYCLMTGMYSWPVLERLPAFRTDGSRWPDDMILLTELDVAEQ